MPPKKTGSKVRFAESSDPPSAASDPPAASSQAPPRQKERAQAAGATLTHPALVTRRELCAALGVSSTASAALAASDTATAAALLPPLLPTRGLKNLGSTCYVNALLQCLFNIPEFRRHVVEFEFAAKHRHERNVAYQLQLLFARLAAHAAAAADSGGLPCIDTAALVTSFGMGQGAHREQHDVQELARVLLDAIQDFSSGLSEASAKVLPSIFQGAMLDEIRCTGCGNVRRSASVFNDVSIPLCSFMGEQYDRAANIVMDSLEQCLDAVTATDFIDGVECSGCGQRTRTAKRQVFDGQRAPLVLAVQLVRMHFDMETNRRVKLLKHVRLPHRLDLDRWCAPRAELGSEEGADVPVSVVYDLMAVIAHRGTAYHGHYYGFLNTPGGGWLKVDDETVAPATFEDVQEYVDPAAWIVAQRTGTPAASTAGGAAPTGEVEPPLPVPTITVEPPLPVPTITLPEDPGAADLDAFFADVAGDAPPTSQRPAAVSGQSYYLFYRRAAVAAAVPPPPGADGPVPASSPPPVENPPAYIQAAMQAELAATRAMHLELQRLQHVVPMAVAVGDTALALAASETAVRTAWLEVDESWTAAALAAAAEAAMLPEELAALRCRMPFCRLRAYNPTEKVMGCAFDSASADSLRTLGYTAGADTTFHVAFESSAVPFTDDPQCWDVPMKIFLQDATDADAFAFIGLRPIPGGIPRDAVVGHLQRVLAAEGRAPVAGMPSTAALCLTSCLGEGVPADWAAAARHAGEGLYVEVADDPSQTGGSGGAPRAAGFYYQQQLMLVECVLAPPGEQQQDDATAAAAPPVSRQQLRIDRRLSLRSVKAQCCAAFGLQPDSAQLLIDHNSRELRNMDLSLSAAAIGTSQAAAYRVRLLPYASIPADHVYADLYAVKQPIQYAAPVTFLKRVEIAPDTLVADVCREVFPAVDATRLRPRLLPPGQKLGLGLPMTGPTVAAHITLAHRQNGGDLRIAIEVLPPSPDGSLPGQLEKGSLVLHVHRWLSEVADCHVALGDGVELVLHKELPASVLVEAIRELLHMPADSSLDAAPAKFYALQSHDLCYAKVPWGILRDEKVLAKPLAAHPLKLEMDDIILVRLTDEEWTFVSERTRLEGHLPYSGGSKLQEPKPKGISGSSGSGGEKKKARGEVAMSIRAVWDVPEEAAPPANPAQGDGSSSTDLQQQDGAASTAADDDDAGGWPASSFLPQDAFDAAIHGTLDDTCKVCYCEFDAGDTVTVLPCHHLFHRDCLAQWVNTNPVCPLCMEPISLR